MRLVVLNTPFPFNHLTDPRTRPHVTAKPICFGTMRQKIGQQMFLVDGQSWWTTRMGFGLQARPAKLVCPSEPLADCPF